MDHVPCTDEFFIKRLISKKRKKERLGLHFDGFFQFFFFYDSWSNTVYTILKLQQHKGDTMKMKSKLYLRITLLINYIMEVNLFDNVE